MRYAWRLSSSKQPQIRSLPLEKLVALKRNPQFLSARQAKALQNSIEQDGFLVPIIVRARGPRYEIVSGNHRVMASREAGLKNVPCVIVRCSDADAARIAVNMNTVHGEPNAELLAPFLAPLADALLKSIYIDDKMLAELKSFDETLSQRLAALEVPDSLNSDSPQGAVPRNCVCPKCHTPHAAARAKLA